MVDSYLIKFMTLWVRDITAMAIEPWVLDTVTSLYMFFGNLLPRVLSLLGTRLVFWMTIEWRLFSLRVYMIRRGVTTLTNAVWAILGLKLSRPGNLIILPNFGETSNKISFDVPIFFCNLPELSRVSRKNFQVSRFPQKSLNSRNNFGFVPRVVTPRYKRCHQPNFLGVIKRYLEYWSSLIDSFYGAHL